MWMCKWIPADFVTILPLASNIALLIVFRQQFLHLRLSYTTRVRQYCYYDHRACTFTYVVFSYTVGMSNYFYLRYISKQVYWFRIVIITSLLLIFEICLVTKGKVYLRNYKIQHPSLYLRLFAKITSCLELFNMLQFTTKFGKSSDRLIWQEQECSRSFSTFPIYFIHWSQ